jgi:hypothetical protein
LIQVEVVLLDKEDVAGNQHLLNPLQFHTYPIYLVLLDNYEPDLEVGGKG